jgi:hypothetical protein
MNLSFGFRCDNLTNQNWILNSHLRITDGVLLLEYTSFSISTSITDPLRI